MTHRTDDADDDGLERKTLVRILIVLGIGIPLLIEGITFASLISNQLLDDGDAGEPNAHVTTAIERVGVGDELLPETAPNETVTDASLTAIDGSWEFTYVVAVTNTANRSYQLQLQSVTTINGRSVDGVRSVSVPPGESETLTATWQLPEGERPEEITVVAITEGTENRTETSVQETIPIERIPVRGR